MKYHVRKPPGEKILTGSRCWVKIDNEINCAIFTFKAGPKKMCLELYWDVSCYVTMFCTIALYRAILLPKRKGKKNKKREEEEEKERDRRRRLLNFMTDYFICLGFFRVCVFVIFFWRVGGKRDK